jgi:hypothetical protein
MLNGLTNKYNIWASTLDRQDVDVMRDRIKNGANLLEDHVFQFYFLNDDFSKLPERLNRIIDNPKLRKRLVIYINPPYADAGNSRQRPGTGDNKGKTTTVNATYNKYKNMIGKATNELFVQFLIRIYYEIPAAKIANFSTLKNLQSPNFSDFRQHFQAKLEKLFLVPANSFDNVNGQFPIGFFVWNTEIKEKFEQIWADVYLEIYKQPVLNSRKRILNFDDKKGFIGKWLSNYRDKTNMSIGVLKAGNNDFQNQNQVYIQNKSTTSHYLAINITPNNLIETAIYFAVRKVIPADWLNDRDQFLFPNKKWEKDIEFHNDCLAYTLFNNSVSAKKGVNHWIPFTENEVGARTGFESHIMITFLSGEKVLNAYSDLFSNLEETKKHSEAYILLFP